MTYVNTLFNTNFLEYASYVIKDRAIPHIDDGLKPVQRRILHSLFEMDDGKFHKVANVVGHCMKYHPHGDASIYSALVVLANKDLFIEKQGNFGNPLTGDEASAARYIECRITPFAKQVLYNPELTAFEGSYDGRNKEPVVLPAKIPVVLIQGAEGIAVGMATKILSHNLIEVLEAVKSSLRKEDFELFPDFLSGGMIDVSEYEDGLGKVLVRALLDKKDPKRIVIREIPYGSTTESLINSIESAARRGKIKIAEINDYTGEQVEIEIKLARGTYAEDVIDSLYAFTECEQAVSVNLLVIKGRHPVTMTVSDVIAYHSKKLVATLKKELEIEQGHLRDRLHARTLERIFIEERIYKEIEQMETQETVLKAVLDGFVPFASQIKRKITDEDIDRLLRIPIRRSLYDINKAKQEMAEINTQLRRVGKNLGKIVEYAIGFLDGIIKEKKGDFKRRTQIISFVKTDAREAAQRNLELRYNDSTGYLGYEVKTGRNLFAVSPYDRVLVIRKSGIYSVIDAPAKIFVDKGMLACGIAEKERLIKTVISVVFRDNKTKHVYIKRCRIEQFILEKTYELVPPNSTIFKLTTKEDVLIRVTYKPKPRLKVLEEKFPIKDFLIKSARAAGVRLSTKEAKSVRFESSKKQSK
jgi:topoisomerase IV subunit A